jgi:hypothetical protein
MEINKSYLKFIEWRNAEDLHEDILLCISNLQFIKDEQHFLENTIKNYTLALIDGSVYEKTKEIIRDLSSCKKDLAPLLKKLMAHSNKLETLLDDVNIPNEMDDYKAEHYPLMIETIAYNSKFKKVKSDIFNLIKQISKKGKQKRLLR